MHGFDAGRCFTEVSELCSSVQDVIIREQLIDKEDLIIVAVSGGADSLALLHLLYSLKGEEILPFSLYVAHLNHGLRGRAAREDAAFVREEARRLGLPCTVGEVDARAFSRNRRLSLEDGARRLRYRFLVQLAQRTGATRVAVGHQCDDQVETLLLNILRGTGLDGLAGMQNKRPLDEGITLIRPLLELSREEVERYCRESKLTPALMKPIFTVNLHVIASGCSLFPCWSMNSTPGCAAACSAYPSCSHWTVILCKGRLPPACPDLLLKEDEHGEHYLVLDGKGLLEEHEALQGRILRLAVRRLLGTVPRDISQFHVRTVLDLLRDGSPHGMLHLPGG
jgi:tRNA(Ile)-lysidine synthase